MRIFIFWCEVRSHDLFYVVKVGIFLNDTGSKTVKIKAGSLLPINTLNAALYFH